MTFQFKLFTTSHWVLLTEKHRDAATETHGAHGGEPHQVFTVTPLRSHNKLRSFVNLPLCSVLLCILVLLLGWETAGLIMYIKSELGSLQKY